MKREGAGMAQFICKQDLKCEENSEKAVQCLNEMATNALMHVDDCFAYLSQVQDGSVFRFCAIPQIMGIGNLALYYNNIQVFRDGVKIRPGLAARVIEGVVTMADVYGYFFHFSSMLKTKINKNDPNVTKTLNRIQEIQKICRDSRTLNKRKLYILESKRRYHLVPMMLITVFMVLVAVIIARVSTNSLYI